ncbi:MAG: bifunctional (p)ppGpp synthetase/guanosine-3',5'-bis(diphosphate) 3'-pyrophosphohydrolase [Chitinophagaceae bacterium]|nr:bifunctional (p)ppGpp synthetase/guanosine-3',5'-bis(diphosphate) 3'-pyrophosphohydrolase [Chitinophagaceae bacterium]
MDQLLEKVKEFATSAHGDQQRKYSPEPYIVHPIRVMEICREYTSDVTVLSAALLHDVIEDTDVTTNKLEQFLLTVLNEAKVSKTLRLVIELTDVYTKQKYPQLNRRKRKEKERARLGKISREAQIIKYADIIDNSGDLAGAETDFTLLWLREAMANLQVMNDGDPGLLEKAKKIVGDALSSEW